jgi:hypothetical protein
MEGASQKHVCTSELDLNVLIFVTTNSNKENKYCE